MVPMTPGPYTNKVPVTPTRNWHRAVAHLLAWALVGAAGCRGERSLGSIEGEVHLAALPTQPPSEVVYPSAVRHCGEQVVDESLQTNGTAVEGAVVFWADAPAQPLSADVKGATLDQRRCRFQPAVLAARAGSGLMVTNSDPLLHNVRAFFERSGHPIFNVAMPLSGMQLQRTLPQDPGVLDVKCDVHPWMRAWVRTFPHAHFAQTDRNGRFRLENVPSGQRRMTAWHPRLGEQTRVVKISPGAPVQLRLVFPAPN